MITEEVINELSVCPDTTMEVVPETSVCPDANAEEMNCLLYQDHGGHY